MTINRDALDLTVQGTPWAPFQTWESPLMALTGYLFKLVHLRTVPTVLTSGVY